VGCFPFRTHPSVHAACTRGLSKNLSVLNGLRGIQWVPLFSFVCGIHRMPRFGDRERFPAFALSAPPARGSGLVWLTYARPAGLSRVRHPLPAAPQPTPHDMLRRPTVVRAGIGEARVRESGGVGIDFVGCGDEAVAAGTAQSPSPLWGGVGEGCLLSFSKIGDARRLIGFDGITRRRIKKTPLPNPSPQGGGAYPRRRFARPYNPLSGEGHWIPVCPSSNSWQPG
jgi:hypothetical protein